MNCAVDGSFARKPSTRSLGATRSTMGFRQWGLLLALSTSGCRSSSLSRQQIVPKEIAAQVSPATHPSSSAFSSAFDKILPDDAPPFSAASLVQFGKGYVRRVYVSGPERVEITIAHFGQDPGAFERWVAGSVNYPQAQLALPATQANGFFSCASDRPEAPCDLHIQLRSGFHVEVMGNGRVSRANLAKLMAYIQLGELSESTLAAL
jgi:hypothetical protein